MIKRIVLTGLAFSFLCGQTALAEPKERLPGPGSHFNFSVTGATLNVLTTTPRRTYPNVGIQILTPGFTVSGNVRPTADGFYLFSASDTVPGSINLFGNGGTVNFKICLNGIGKKYTCENHTATVSSSHYIFVTSSSYFGNLGGITGADAICQAVAYQAGSVISVPNLKFKALLVTSTRYPCSSTNGGISGSCGGSFAKNWPLIPNTPYLMANGQTVFNTANQYAVFDGSKKELLTEQGDSASANIWTGIQSIFTNAQGSDIIAWAYTDMNSAADSDAYNNNLATCNDFTSASDLVSGVYGAVGASPVVYDGPLPGLTWGNYYYFADNQSPYISNLFTTANNRSCDIVSSLICVS